MWHAKKSADVDNLCKSTLDALNGVVFVDDAQVAVLEANKTYAAKGKILLTITTLP